MMLKFRSERLGCWVTEDCIRRVMVSKCHFLSEEEAKKVDGPLHTIVPGNTETIQDEDSGVDVKLVPMTLLGQDASGVQYGPAIDWDWIVDNPLQRRTGTRTQGDCPFKVVRVEYRDGAGWPSPEKVFIFAIETRVFTLGDDGKTIERL